MNHHANTPEARGAQHAEADAGPLPLDTMLRRVAVRSAIGAVSLLWTVGRDRPVLIRVVLADPDGGVRDSARKMLRDARPESCTAMDELADALQGMLTGNAVTMDDRDLDEGAGTPFQRTVWRRLKRIPRRQITSYAQLAASVGYPAAIRAVGNAVGTNPFPLIRPCHRVIRADGRLGGFQGGTAMKRRLLEMEGVAVNGAGRVVGADGDYGKNFR